MAGPNIYSATYSNIPVYEFQFGSDLKEHVMRRRHDDWINATHILKAAGFDKPARTRILEREVQKEIHEKVQGGYGKYQGTWVPLDAGEALAVRNNIYDKLRPIFVYTPGDKSPPPAPKHATNKSKAPKKPAVPKFSNKPAAAPARASMISEDYDQGSSQMADDDPRDDITVDSASIFDDDRYDMSQPPTGHRKRKREDLSGQNLIEQQHRMYADELLDYFMLSREDDPGTRPEPPANYMPDWHIDQEEHTALHWAAAMGDIDLIRQLKRFNADLSALNIRGETPLIRSVMFTNCQDKQTFPKVVQELISTVKEVDYCQSSVLHHAAATCNSRMKHSCIRYYLDILLNRLTEFMEPDDFAQFLDAQDQEGNTAVLLAAKNGARKCVRALIGRGASTSIRNNEGQTADEFIQKLNRARRTRNLGASSSPFAPDSHMSLIDPALSEPARSALLSHQSEAANTVESKVTPLLVEKIHELAKSFDDDMTEQQNIEQEAARALSTANADLAAAQIELAKLRNEQERMAPHTQKMSEELEELELEVLGLLERNQAANLKSLLQHSEKMEDGKMVNGESADERIELAKALVEERNRRHQLLREQVEAAGKAGMAERGDMYRALIAKCLNMKADEVDDAIDGLIEYYEEERSDSRESVF